MTRKNSNKLKGKPLLYNASQQIKYRRSIMKLVRRMIFETNRDVRELFKTPEAIEFKIQQKIAAMDGSISLQAKKVMDALTAKFNRLFALGAPALATKMVEGAQQTSASSLHTSLETLTGGLTLATGVIPKGMEEVAQAIVQENVSLIKSIPQKYFDDVTGSVMRSISSGGEGLKTLIPELRQYAAITDRRVTNLALDQTRKAYNSINRQRMQALGVKKFEWRHSGGGQHPRKTHMAMSGNIYSFDDLPVINLDQEGNKNYSPVRGIPGQAINCKCFMIPVIEFDDEE